MNTLRLRNYIFHADKKTRKFKKTIYLIVLIFAMCCLWRINLLLKENTENAGDSGEDISDMTFSLPSKFIGKQLPFHQIYEARNVKYPSDLKEKPVSSNKTKLILLWTQWNGVKKTINYYSPQLGDQSFVKYGCPNQKCIITRKRRYLKTADAVLFHLLDTTSSNLPSYRNAEQLWIVYNMEPPWLIKKHLYPDLPNLKGIFNWTMSYRSNSDIIARYGFIAPTSTSKNYVPFYNKTKNVVWFVSDCVTDSNRENYAKELSKYIDVDTYGTCGDHKCFPSQSATCYESVLQKYKFYLSFENALCKDYVTEKFFNVFNYDIIPVVFGRANYSSIIPAGTFIDATQYSDPERLAMKLHEISHREDLYRNFLSKKRSFVSYLDPWTCRLCDKLHTNNKPSVLRDVEQWWLKDAQCKTWNNLKNKFEDSIFKPGQFHSTSDSSTFKKSHLTDVFPLILLSLFLSLKSLQSSLNLLHSREFQLISTAQGASFK